MSYSLEGIQEFQVFKIGRPRRVRPRHRVDSGGHQIGHQPIVRVGVRLLPQPGHGGERLLLEAGERRRRRTALPAVAGRRVDRRAAGQGQGVLLRRRPSTSDRTSSCRGRRASFGSCSCSSRSTSASAPTNTLPQPAQRPVDPGEGQRQPHARARACSSATPASTAISTTASAPPGSAMLDYAPLLERNGQKLVNAVVGLDLDYRTPASSTS